MSNRDEYINKKYGKLYIEANVVRIKIYKIYKI